MSATPVRSVPARFVPATFEGDFDALPLRAHLLFGEVPAYPIEADFHAAVSVAFGADDAAAEWRVEAIRWRLHHPGVPMDLHAIALKTSARLYAAHTAEVL